MFRSCNLISAHPKPPNCAGKASETCSIRAQPKRWFPDSCRPTKLRTYVQSCHFSNSTCSIIHHRFKPRQIRAYALDPIAAGEQLSGDPNVITSAVVGAVLVGLGTLGWRFALYSQMEYITASMITRYVPKASDGARVIQVGGGTKELFYYPKGTILVNYVDEKADKGLLETAAVQAQVGVMARKQSPTSFEFASDASIDAVVCIKALCQLQGQQLQSCLAEVYRVLKPGCPLIFLEPASSQGAPLRFLIGSGPALLDTSVLDGLKGSTSYEVVQWDMALEGQDPHAVGVAFKSAVTPPAAPKPKAKPTKERAQPSKETEGFGGKSRR